MEKIVAFIDCHWLSETARELGCEPDYASLLGYLADPDEGRLLQEAFAYIPIDPRRAHAADATMRDLWDAGCLVRSKLGSINEQLCVCDFGIEIALDMMRSSYEMKPDILVVVSGDDRLLPVVLELRTHGIRVEVASFGSAISPSLSHRCSGFISLDAVAGNDAGRNPQDCVCDCTPVGSNIPMEEATT